MTEQLTNQELVWLAYGTRAVLLDLQHRQMVGDRSPELRRLIEEANRAVERIDEIVLLRSMGDKTSSSYFFEELKATHNGSIQRLSQRIKIHL